MSGSDQAATKPWLRVKSRASSGHRGSLEIFGTITRCLVNAAAPQEALSGPIRHGVMAALNVAGAGGPATLTRPPPVRKENHEVNRGPTTSKGGCQKVQTPSKI